MVATTSVLERLIVDNVAAARVVVHVGAGECSEIEAYRRLEPETIVLVEPNPRSVVALRTKIPEADVVQAAVSASEGRASLQVTNDPRFCALSDLSGLEHSYPGLAVTGQREVRTMPLSAVIGRSGATSEDENLLVGEFLGVEAEVLGSVKKDDLKRFSHIFIRMPLGDAPPDQDLVRSRLVDADFSVVNVRDGNAPFAVYVGSKSHKEALFDTEAFRRKRELEQIVNEYQYRQELLEAEFVKTNGQIDLLRSLLTGER